MNILPASVSSALLLLLLATPRPAVAVELPMGNGQPRAGIEIPAGSNAQVEGVKGTGLLKISYGKRIYYTSLTALVGFLPKANGSGCTLAISSDKGVELVDVATSQEDVLNAVKLARD